MYNIYLSGIEELILPIEKEWAKSAYWMYSILLRKESCHISRDNLIAALRKQGIETRPIFYPLHKMPPYKQKGSFSNAEKISASGVSLPSGVTLEKDQIIYICEKIKSLVRKH